MKRYLKEAGFTYKEDYNDLTNRQFTLSGVVYSNSEASTLSGIKLDREESYSLFLKDFDPSDFKNKMEMAINSAIRKGVNVTISNNIEVEKVENGYNIAITFLIQG